MADEFDDLVVGAGIVGLTAALLLARAGHRVGVITAEPVGGGSTGRSAGVVSRLHGLKYRRLARETARRNAIAYREMNDDGFALIAGLLEDRDVPHERRDALLVALRPDGAARIDDEHLAAHRAGLRAQKAQRVDLPFAHHGALRLPDQILVDPARLLAELAMLAQEAGALLVERERVLDVRVRPGGWTRVETGSAERAARHVVLATGTPVLDRGLYALKTQAYRLLSVAGAGGDPAGPMVTAIGAAGSTTFATDAEGRTTAFGEAHPVGVGGPESARLAALERSVADLVPGFARASSWSGQDYRPYNPIAFVGAFPASAGAVSFATGFDGWGLTNGAAAAIRVVNARLGARQPRWATTIGCRATRPASIAGGLRSDLGLAAERVAGPRRLTPGDRRLLRDGQGIVHAGVAGPVATSLTGGVIHSVTAACSRGGGVVAWNDVELSWDCPVCGSRFAPDGSVLEGGARNGLVTVAAPGAPDDAGSS